MIRVLVVAIALAVMVEPAQAHAPIKGIGAFYNGLLHPLFVPAHLLLVFGFGLLLGQHAPNTSRFGWLAFVAALWTGLVIGHLSGTDVPVMLLLLTALAAGLLVAVDWSIPGVAAAALGGVAGFTIGMDSMPEPLTSKETLLALAGTGVGAALIVSYIGGAAAWLQAPWQRIGIRVAGSWTAASALLVLALAIVGPKASGPLP
jgi:urease accessory protein